MEKEDSIAADTVPARTEALSEAEITVKRISDGLETLVSADDYHLFIHDETNEGGVGWQIHFVKDGENTLWWSTDHRTQEGHMVLNQQNYTYVEKNDGVWVAADTADNSLEPLLEQFSFKNKELFNIKSEVKRDAYGTRGQVCPLSFSQPRSSSLLDMVSDIFQATSSILLAAFAARRRVGLVLGIISTATAPAAAPIPAVTAHPFTVIAIPPSSLSMPKSNYFSSGCIFPFHPDFFVIQ